MSEAMIEVVVPLMPALAAGWMASAMIGGVAAPKEDAKSIALSLLGGLAVAGITEGLGFVACRWAYRTFLMLL